MKTLAAILVETGRPLAVEELEIPVLKPGQVLIEVAFSGVCHTQVLECRGHRGKDAFLPHCLGHEGSGVVRELGPGVGKVRVGEKVILSWMKGTGADVPGTLYRWNGRTVNSGAITTFSRHSVISENRLTPLPEGIPMEQAALLGCAAPTGLGAVLNAAAVRPGTSVAVFGTGGVGLFAVAGAAIVGAVPIVAVDVRPQALELARIMGATHAVDASKEDALAQLARLAPKGLDFAIEASGRPDAMRQALLCVRQQGGTAVIVGNARHGETLELDPRQLNLGKRLLGTWGGDNRPDEDFPRYCRLAAAGKLKLETLISKTYRLEEIDGAIEDLASGRVPRPLIGMEE